MAARSDVESVMCIFDYLRTLDSGDFDMLYSDPPTCLIVFRELKDLAKQIVHRLLFLEQTIPKSIIAGWVPISSSKLLEQACRDLFDLRVLQSIDNGSRESWRLSKKFQESMKVSLFGGYIRLCYMRKSSSGVQLLSDLGSSSAEKHPKDDEFLNKYATDRWDVILQYMVGTETAEVGECVKDVLILSGLMKSDGGLSRSVTRKGFQFLLMNRPTQVLRFMLHYFDYLRSRNKNIIEALHFVFQLSFLSIGKSYPTNRLTAAQLDLLQHMRELGLAYQRKRTAPRFYVTRLALSLALGSSSAVSGQVMSNEEAETDRVISVDRVPTGVSSHGSKTGTSDCSEVGYILVETNFRLYAYTDSYLKTALLNLFSKIRIRYPNLVVADITRDSIRGALTKGISASQIISFLTTNAHPDMLKMPTILPPTLVDQIHLWEKERERLFSQDGCLYEQFNKVTDFEMVRDFAKTKGYLLWECAERRMMVVSKEGHVDVRAFWNQKKPM